MPTFELEESEYKGPVPEDTVLQAEVIGCRIVEEPFYEDDGVTKVRKVEFKFIVRHPGSQWDGETYWGKTPVRFNTHVDCKLKNWAQAIEGYEFPEKYNLDTDILLNKPCRIVMGQRAYKKDGEDKIFCFVRDVMPARQTAGAVGVF